MNKEIDLHGSEISSHNFWICTWQSQHMHSTHITLLWARWVFLSHSVFPPKRNWASLLIMWYNYTSNSMLHLDYNTKYVSFKIIISLWNSISLIFMFLFRTYTILHEVFPGTTSMWSSFLFWFVLYVPFLMSKILKLNIFFHSEYREEIYYLNLQYEMLNWYTDIWIYMNSRSKLCENSIAWIHTYNSHLW
jgi:hypothetical protein